VTALMRHPMAAGLIAALTALVTIAGYLQTDASPVHIGWTALLFAILASLAWIDATTETVPDAVTLALVVTGIAHATAVGAALWPIAGGAVLLVALGSMHGRITGDHGWIGSGDFFLIAGVFAWFGPLLVMDILALTFVGLLFQSLIARRTTIAVAPSLAAAAALVWIGGPIL